MNRLLLLALSAIAFGLTGPVLAQDDLLTPVKAAGTIRIPNTQGHVPWDFLDDKNELVGVELGREIAERMGIENVEFIPARFSDLIPGVQADRFALVIAGHSITEERANVAGFSQRYMAIGTSIFFRDGDERIRTLDNIDGKSAGTLARSTPSSPCSSSLWQDTCSRKPTSS
ncbi:transporter substrate-binding domain-containing protein [Shinella sp. DD12]|uniref:transporter substrate-binding domain-containing protein n=1 Tax=Shinella sp. DD12 TaxID=1410620 RepID=UPI0003C552A2|nr:transporter substrate-binding domain-containing protein [Shinella sp. DD12]EYR83811.1 ABC-type amino acid transport system periplasmic component [Shinella sp. DD12]